MIQIFDVLGYIRNSSKPFSIGYRKLDGSYSEKKNILGSVKAANDGKVTLFDGKGAFNIYVDLIVKFDNLKVKH